MSAHDTMTELRELRERLQGADADKTALLAKLVAAQSTLRERDRQLEEVTHHRNRLLAEKDVAWGRVLSPDTIASEIPVEPDTDPDQLSVLDERSELEC
jgi:predicted nuclease with TOPRIM domain